VEHGRLGRLASDVRLGCMHLAESNAIAYHVGTSNDASETFLKTAGDVIG